MERIAAGSFVTWLGQITAAVTDGADSQVPCGSCSACCRSSQFILVTDRDLEARRVIPADLLFAAPGLPQGNHVMGYDAEGCCPMFVDQRCSIYANRPQACRTYDCRIFAATGIDVAIDGHDEIASRVGQWQFELDSDGEAALTSVRAAAQYVETNAARLGLEHSATGRAIAAITMPAQP